MEYYDLKITWKNDGDCILDLECIKFHEVEEELLDHFEPEHVDNIMADLVIDKEYAGIVENMIVQVMLIYTAGI